MAGTLDRDALKRAAAERAVALVTDGMVLGLGSGSTAEIAVELLAQRVTAGLDIVGIPTSERTRVVYVPVNPGGPVPPAEEFVIKPEKVAA